MDSGRLALLEKAREFGSLAKNWSIDEFLERTITYRTLALYLGVETLWWSEFWRSFSFACIRDNDDGKLRSFHFCCKARDAQFILFFLSLWFGTDTKISDIPKEEFQEVYHRIMRA